MYRREIVVVSTPTILNPNFWDCECDEHYIHPGKYKKCPKCGARRDEMPDSRQNEIDEGTHFYGGKKS